MKQSLAAIRMQFDRLVVGQVLPHNPAAAVRGPKHVVKTGKTPVLDGALWRRLIDAIPTATVRDLRDRALIAALTFSFARIGAALAMRVEDVRVQGDGWALRLHEKGGKQHAMPCHHALAEALHAYLEAAGIADDRQGVLFRTSRGRRGRDHGPDRLPHLQGDGHYRLSGEGRHAGTRAGHGGARKPAHHQALRPEPQTAHPRGGRADQAVGSSGPLLLNNVTEQDRISAQGSASDGRSCGRR
ncbi:MAG: tyrosine-type recombinase/integrase [Acetobacteraceae bacterium]